MLDPPTLPAARRFSATMQRLGHSALERGTNRMGWGGLLRPLSQELRNAMWHQLRALLLQLIALMERSIAGTLPVASPRAARAAAEQDRPVRADGVLALPPLGEPLAPVPRAFGWFARLSPRARCAVSDMRLLPEDAEPAALVASHSGFVRIIRPLCHMPGTRPHPHMIAFQPMPKRARTPRPLGHRRAGYCGRTSAFGGPNAERRAKNE